MPEALTEKEVAEAQERGDIPVPSSYAEYHEQQTGEPYDPPEDQTVEGLEEGGAQQTGEMQQTSEGQEGETQADPDRPITLSEVQRLLQEQGQPQHQDPNLLRDAQFARELFQNDEMMAALQGVQQKEQEIVSPEVLPLPDKPVKPRRPNNFSVNAANENPDSASARFMDEMHQYNEDVNNWQIESQTVQHQNQQNWIDYQRKRDEQKESAWREQQEEQRALAQQRQNVQAVHNDLVSKYGLSKADASDFIQATLSGELDNNPAVLIEAWKNMRNQKQAGGNGATIPPKLQTAPQKPVRSPGGSGVSGLPSNANPPEKKSATQLMAEYMVLRHQDRQRRLNG